jgi:hypothetical protein
LKYILMLAFVVSCSSHHHDPSPAEVAAKAAFKAEVGLEYSKFEEAFGKPEQCVEFSDHKYCEWKEKNQINFFKGDKYVSEVKAPAKPFNYEINRECMIGDQKAEKTFQPVPGSKSVSTTSLAWKKHFPQIAKTLKASGLNLAKGDQQLKISYGLKELPGSTVKRYLTLSAVQNKEELWKVNVSSKGTSRDLNQVMPVLLLASYDLVSEPSNENKSMILSDSSLHVIGFRHFLQTK